MLADGSYSRWPTGAVGVLIPLRGSSSLNPSRGLLIGGPRTAGFGLRQVNLHGLFMDYDGQPQARPDVTTRGMVVLDSGGCVVARYYLNVFPTLTVSGLLGRRVAGPRGVTTNACPVLASGGVPELQPGAARAAGLVNHQATRRSPTSQRQASRGRRSFHRLRTRRRSSATLRPRARRRAAPLVTG